MSIGLSDQIRELAETKYIKPEVLKGKVEFSIRVRDLLDDLRGAGFPSGHTPQVCSVLQTTKFLRENGLEIVKVDGPPSKMSTTVVYHYRVAKPGSGSNAPSASTPEAASEAPHARTMRAAESLRGLLKEEMAAYGGAEGFIRWVRGYDEEDAA
jgi:hypothetical protein